MKTEERSPAAQAAVAFLEAAVKTESGRNAIRHVMLEGLPDLSLCSDEVLLAASRQVRIELHRLYPTIF